MRFDWIIPLILFLSICSSTGTNLEGEKDVIISSSQQKKAQLEEEKENLPVEGVLSQRGDENEEDDVVYSNQANEEGREIITINIGLVLSQSETNESKHLKADILNHLKEINEKGKLAINLGEKKVNLMEKRKLLARKRFKFELIMTNLVSNPIEMSRIVCENLIGNQTAGVSAVIVDTNQQFTASIASISFTLGLYNVPLIGTTLRDSSLFNKNLHSSYISLIPPYSHQADVWCKLMLELRFKRAFVLISSENSDLLSRFVDLIDQLRDPEYKFKISSIIQYDSASFSSEQLAWQHFVKLISNLLANDICRVFLIHAQSRSDLQFFLNLIDYFGMTSEGFALVFSERSIQVANEHKMNLPSGIITSQLNSSSGEAKLSSPEATSLRSAYAIDALDIIVRSISQLMIDQGDIGAFQRDVPNSCKRSPTFDWSSGVELFWSILGQTLSGQTGLIAFDENGDRLTASYKLLNLAQTQSPPVNETAINGGQQLVYRTVGWFKNGPLKRRMEEEEEIGDNEEEFKLDQSTIEINVNSIQWPGKVEGQLISGFYVGRHLRIVTLQEKPFVWVSSDRDCWKKGGANNWSSGEQNKEPLSLPCRRSLDGLEGEERLCCMGYCMDLLDEISRQLNFTFDLYLAPDNQYGSLEQELDERKVGRPIESESGSKQPIEGQANGTRENRISSILGNVASILANRVSANFGLQSGSEKSNPMSAEENNEKEKDNDWQMSQFANSFQEENNDSQLAEEKLGKNNRLRWSGLIGELVSRRADMAFAPLTITPQRAHAIDFSKPFKFHGFSILLRRAPKHTTLASFLQPFHNQLWMLVIGVATHVVALSLYLLDRYSTFGRFGMKRRFIPKTPRNSHDDHPLHLSSSLWFSWSILLNSGVGEHTPKSLSGRVLGIFWSGFAMIVVASYTANLAAFLVLDSREETPTLSGIDDPRLRSGDLAFNFATVKSSAVDAYLQSQVEYINLYRKMEEFNFANVDESILALRAGQIDALIWDSTRLEWEVAMDEKCSLGIAGELFGSSGYGIGLQKDSYWTKNITTKLLELHENGFMIELDKKWIAAANGNGRIGANQPANCERRNEDYPETLGIFNIAGVFILFACGLITSCALILLERLCFKHRASLLDRQRIWWRRLKFAK